MQSTTVLRVASLRKSYGSFEALKSVDFELRSNEIHGLCGENGAGKSTLVKILGGIIPSTSGEIIVDGQLLRSGKRTDPSLISIVHQELSIIPALSVLDNVLMGHARVKQFYLRNRHASEVRQQLDALGLEHLDLYMPASKTSLAEQQLIEIARCVLHGAKVLILDEPTATLADSEIIRVFKAVRWLRDSGTTVIFISHRLNEVFDLTDRITVFRNGERILTTDTRELNSESLIKAMVGREVEKRPVESIPSFSQETEPLLSLLGFSVPGKVSPLSLDVLPGQILGVVGQLGSGADLLVEAVAGVRGYTGVIRMGDRVANIVGPRQALASRIAYVPEDRAGKGVFLDATVETNSTASILADLVKNGRLDENGEGSIAAALSARFTLDPKRLHSPVSSLSGGNQQKVAIAKAVATNPIVLILNEPTRGVDVGARAEIYEQLRAMTEDGVSIIFFSTDFEEVLELADRVVTFFKGAMVTDKPVTSVRMESILTEIIHGSELGGGHASAQQSLS